MRIYDVKQYINYGWCNSSSLVIEDELRGSSVIEFDWRKLYCSSEIIKKLGPEIIPPGVDLTGWSLAKGIAGMFPDYKYYVVDSEGNHWRITDYYFICIETGKRKSRISGTLIDVRKELQPLLEHFRPKVRVRTQKNLGKIYRYNKVLSANGLIPDINFDIISTKQDFLDMLDFEGLTLSEINTNKLEGRYIKDDEVYTTLTGVLTNRKTGKVAKDELIYYRE